MFNTWTSAESKQYIQSFKLEEDRRARLCVRGMAKLLLAATEKGDPSQFQIQKRPTGAVFSPESMLHFSFSHTRTHAAVALSFQRCGIDIENNDRKVNREQISGRFFTAEEHNEVVRDPQSFFKIWTAKEAFLKREGTGIDRPLKSIRVSLEDRSISYKDNAHEFYTEIKEVPQATTLSIIGGSNFREVEIHDLLEMHFSS